MQFAPNPTIILKKNKNTMFQLSKYPPTFIRKCRKKTLGIRFSKAKGKKIQKKKNPKQEEIE